MSEDRYRLVVLGSAKVGKTSLIRRYLYNEFSEKYKETIEDLHSRLFRIQGVPLNLDILDTNFTFPDMRRIAINSASAFLLVFSVDDVQSFKEMSELWQEICDRRPDISALPVVVAGNKADLQTKKIYEATATAFTSRLSADVRYLEASAKNCHNVTEIFRTLLELSGFPRCKVRFIHVFLPIFEFLRAGGGALDDTDEPNGTDKSSPSLRRANTTRAGRSSSKKEKFQERNGGPPLDKQTSTPSLNIPIISELKRNRSFKIKSAREEKHHDGKEEESKLSRSSSLIRRTKHLSLKMKGRGNQPVDESDCNIQ